MYTAVAALLAYLLGSIPFAIIVSRLFGLADPRTYGSKNPGATNVLRSGNRWAAALTLFLDGFKGWLAVWLTLRFGAAYHLDDDAVALAAIAVFLGHLYPVFYGFQGGKGVATALGVTLAVAWWLGVLALLTWIIVALFFRYSSLASLSALLIAPFLYVLGVEFDVIAMALLTITLFAVYRHRGNIANLLAGRETRIGQKSRGAADNASGSR